MPETPGVVVASTTLSAIFASSSRVVDEGIEASTILTLVGRRCSKSYFRIVLSNVAALSPRSCCGRRSS